MNEVSAFGVIHKADDSTRLLRQHGLTGAPPKDMSRDERMALWEARSKKLNQKRDKYQRRSTIAHYPEHGGEVVSGAAGAALGGAALRDAYYKEHPKTQVRHFMNAVDRGAAIHAAGEGKPKPIRAAFRGAAKVPVKLVMSKPGWRTLATAGGAAGVSAVSSRVRINSDKKARKYSSMKGGVASGAYKRMKDYS